MVLQPIGRRKFIALMGGAAVWPQIGRAQQASTPVIGFLSGRSLSSDAHLVTAFGEGLGESGYTDGQNVKIEYRWANEQFDRLVPMAADLLTQQVSVVFAVRSMFASRRCKASISSTPIVFATGGDLVELGVVGSVNRPGGNVTGVTVIASELLAQATGTAA